MTWNWTPDSQRLHLWLSQSQRCNPLTCPWGQTEEERWRSERSQQNKPPLLNLHQSFSRFDLTLMLLLIFTLIWQRFLWIFFLSIIHFAADPTRFSFELLESDMFLESGPFVGFICTTVKSARSVFNVWPRCDLLVLICSSEWSTLQRGFWKPP